MTGSVAPTTDRAVVRAAFENLTVTGQPNRAQIADRLGHDAPMGFKCSGEQQNMSFEMTIRA